MLALLKDLESYLPTQHKLNKENNKEEPLLIYLDYYRVASHLWMCNNAVALLKCKMFTKQMRISEKVTLYTKLYKYLLDQVFGLQKISTNKDMTNLGLFQLPFIRS